MNFLTHLDYIFNQDLFLVVKELEREAQQLSKEFYKLSKQLQTKLNQISAASVCCMQTFNEAIGKTCDSLDECTKENAALLQKANDLSKSMEPIYKLQIKINSIKTILSALETQI